MAEEANVKDKSEQPSFKQELVDFLRDLRSKVGIDNKDRAAWKNKMVIANNQRLGVKRYTNFPYPGAPDIPLPETDKLIKKSVPNLVLSAWSPKKMCVVQVQQGVEETPEMHAKAQKAELAMNMFLRSPDMGLFRKLMLAADNRKQYGHCIFKVSEKFTCRMVSKVLDMEEGQTAEMLKMLSREEKVLWMADTYNLDPEDKEDMKVIEDVLSQIASGTELVEFEVKEYKSMPMIDVPDPMAVCVPSYTKDINEANRVREEFFLPRHIVEQLMEDEIFLTKDLDHVPYWQGGEDEQLEQTKSRNEGVVDNSSKTDLYRMEMISCWYREKDSEQYYRKIYTFFADVSAIEDALVQDIDFPFEFAGWMYEKDDNETKDSRYYSSRGVPEQIRAMQEIMERSINNKIIRDEVTNTPMWEVLHTSEIMDAHVRMIPGGKLPVKALGTEIKQLSEMPHVDPNSTEIMTTLKAYTEEYLSVSDQLFRNATNAGGGKTLGEIQVGIQQNSGPLNLEVISWNETLSRVYYKVFLILRERMNDSIFIQGNEITKEDFNFPAEVRSNGDLEVANSQMATSKVERRLAVIMNPALADIVNSEDRYNALRDWLEKDGVKDPDMFCTDPKKIATEQIAQLQGQVQGLQAQAGMLQKGLQDSFQQKQQVDRQKSQSEAEVAEAEQTATNMQMENIATGLEGAANGLFAGAGAGAG